GLVTEFRSTRGPRTRIGRSTPDDAVRRRIVLTQENRKRVQLAQAVSAFALICRRSGSMLWTRAFPPRQTKQQRGIDFYLSRNIQQQVGKCLHAPQASNLLV